MDTYPHARCSTGDVDLLEALTKLAVIKDDFLQVGLM